VSGASCRCHAVNAHVTEVAVTPAWSAGSLHVLLVVERLEVEERSARRRDVRIASARRSAPPATTPGDAAPASAAFVRGQRGAVGPRRRARLRGRAARSPCGLHGLWARPCPRGATGRRPAHAGARTAASLRSGRGHPCSATRIMYRTRRSWWSCRPTTRPARSTNARDVMGRACDRCCRGRRSRDDTARIAAKLHTRIRRHGRNSATARTRRLLRSPSTPAPTSSSWCTRTTSTRRSCSAMVSLSGGLYPACRSRILGGGARRGGMPLALTSRTGAHAVQNILLGSKLSEFHTGYRAYSRALLERVPFDRDSDDFVFDNRSGADPVAGRADRRGELPTRYAENRRHQLPAVAGVRVRLPVDGRGVPAREVGVVRSRLFPERASASTRGLS